MAWTQSDIDRLKVLMSTGVVESEFVSGDSKRRQRLMSFADMQKLLADMQAEVGGGNGLSRRRTVAGYCSGL